MTKIVFATEMDTLTQTLRAAYGQFGDLIRCIFEHETVSQLRRQNNEFIEIRNPRIAMLPKDFTKQDAVKQAQVLGVGLKSLDRWLAKFVQTDDLQHISHGIYRKRIYQTA